jgi:hypothetical protein
MFQMQFLETPAFTESKSELRRLPEAQSSCGTKWKRLSEKILNKSIIVSLIYRNAKGVRFVPVKWRELGGLAFVMSLLITTKEMG